MPHTFGQYSRVRQKIEYYQTLNKIFPLIKDLQDIFYYSITKCQCTKYQFDNECLLCKDLCDGFLTIGDDKIPIAFFQKVYCEFNYSF